MDAGRTIASAETPRVPRWAARLALWLPTVAMLASSAGPCAADPSSSIEVHDRAGLLAAAASAKPGTRIALRAGYYGGGVTLTGLAGTAEQPIEIYAADPTVEYVQREETERALREALGYLLYQDLRRGWRITAPPAMSP